MEKKPIRNDSEKIKSNMRVQESYSPEKIIATKTQIGETILNLLLTLISPSFFEFFKLFLELQLVISVKLFPFPTIIQKNNFSQILSCSKNSLSSNPEVGGQIISMLTSNINDSKSRHSSSLFENRYMAPNQNVICDNRTAFIK